MIRIYYCTHCGKVFFVIGYKTVRCNTCNQVCTRIFMNYKEFTDLNKFEREKLLEDYRTIK